MQLARAVEKVRQRHASRRRDVVRAGRAALGRQAKRFDAVIAMGELERGVVARHRWHQLQVEVLGERLRLVSVEAVAESQHEDVDARVASGEVVHVGLDLDVVAHELMARVAVEAVVLAQSRRQVDSRSVHMARGLEDETRHRAAFPGTTCQQVEGADHVHLVRAPWIHVERIDAGQRVHDSVDPDRSHQLADERVADVELQVVSAAEVVARLADVDADHLGDVGILD